jgi:hypothetical protein
MIRTLVILLMFGYFAKAQATCEENRYVNLPHLQVRIIGQEGEAIKGLAVTLQMGTIEKDGFFPVTAAVEFDESTYEYVIPKQIVPVPNTVLPDQKICSQTPKNLAITVGDYKPTKTLDIHVDKYDHFAVSQPRFTIEVKLNDADKIIGTKVVQSN